MVGAFIVGGLVLTVASIVVLGSSTWFSAKATLIIYFEDSVSGLDRGAAVNLRGVRIGQVKEVLIRYNQAPDDLDSPVLIEVDTKALQAKTDQKMDWANPVFMENEIRRGLRAELALESYLTGRLVVELGSFPDADPPVLHQLGPVYPEIPSRPTKLTRIMRTLSQIDIVAIANKLESVLTRVDRGIEDLEVRKLSDSAVEAMKSVQRLADSADIKKAMDSLHQTSEELRRLIANVDSEVAPLAKNANQTFDAAANTLVEVRKSFAELRDLLEARSPLRTDLETTLTSLADAAQSLAALSEFLRRNPQALLTGRQLPARAK